jgi:putative ABC transport system permease protein
MAPGRMLRVSGFLAGRSLIRGNRGVTAMTVAVLLLIYVDLLFVPSLIQGAVDKINSQVTHTLTSTLQIMPTHGSHDIGDVSAYLSQIRSTKGVAATTATYRVGSEISHADESNVWTVDAIDPSSYGQVFRTPFNLAEGRYLAAADTASIFLGIQIAGMGNQSLRSYATSLKTVHTGDQVTVTLVNGQNETLQVQGIFNDQFLLADQKAYVTQQWASQVLPAMRDRATTIFVKSDGTVPIDTLVSKLEPLRGDVSYHTSAELVGPINDEVDTFNLINDILRTITLFVALITVFIVTYVDLVNHRRQIGIERAIGISPTAVILSYMYKAVVYACLGVGLGAVLFLAVAGPFVERHPFLFPFGPAALGIRASEMWRDALILVVVAAISACIPAWRSVRIRILDAIWST